MIPTSGIAGSLQGKSLAEWKLSGSLEIISRENKLDSSRIQIISTQLLSLLFGMFVQ